MSENENLRNVESASQYFTQIEEKLRQSNFETFRCKDGSIGVRKGIKNLGTIGEHGEFYCNSSDLTHPYWKDQIEKVMQTIEEVNAQIRQDAAEAPEQAPSEMTLE